MGPRQLVHRSFLVVWWRECSKNGYSNQRLPEMVTTKWLPQNGYQKMVLTLVTILSGFWITCCTNSRGQWVCNGHVQPPAPFLPQDVQAVHCTLRGDALWFGVKAGACDKVPWQKGWLGFWWVTWVGHVWEHEINHEISGATWVSDKPKCDLGLSRNKRVIEGPRKTMRKCGYLNNGME